jgi:TPP-dependent pyruvate/acetoin dehydrogenase alpha subunit
LKEDKISLLRYMMKVRCFEESVAKKKEEGAILGPVHTTIGQEAVDVGVCRALEKKDYIIGTHRSHGYMLAKGIDMNEMMAEIYGKRTGTNGGKGGSMHVSDKRIGSLGATGIVGSGLPIACGAAFAAKYKKEQRISCVFFGDGAANEGTFHESLNLASLWKLPVLFLLKNNGLAITAPLKQTTSNESFVERANAYNVKGYKVDGQDVSAVYNLTRSVRESILAGEGPVLIEANVIRFREHQEGLGYKKIADTNYRDNTQLNTDKKFKDPLINFSNELIYNNFLTKNEVDDMFFIERELVENSIKFAENSSLPDRLDAFSNIYM